MKAFKTKVCIIGAGAGGFGCIYCLVKNGVDTIIVDKNEDFGGTAVFSGVDGWEPSVSLDGVHKLLKEELEEMDNGAHVLEIVPNCNLFFPENGLNWDNHSFEKYPWGLSVPSEAGYDETLKRCTALRKNASMKRFQFQPHTMRAAMNKLLAPYKDKYTAFFGWKFCDCRKKGRKIKSVVIEKDGEKIRIAADCFVDASGDIALCRNAGCRVTIGSEARTDYGEMSAPQDASERINAVTYVFRISKHRDENHIDEVPAAYREIDISDWEREKMRKVVSCFCLYPDGDINVNMLPTMEGTEYMRLGDTADDVGRARVHAYWRYLQTEKGMNGYFLKEIFAAGVRESYRLVGRYVLCENDLRGGMLAQPKRGRTVAIADHALDVHGNDGMCKELEWPYEIPLECAMPQEFDNLFVACRGASFTHIAAAGARLTRTMLSLGEGVGEYISEIIK